MRRAFYLGGCIDHDDTEYDTFLAAKETLLDPRTADWSSTAAEVGGFGGASDTNNGNGSVTMTIENTSGAKSFFYHAVPDAGWTTGPLSNIDQRFKWTELPAGRNCGC